MLRDGEADLISFARAYIANPDLGNPASGRR
jgi:2,4-dienoyl-CoA reductase-like NADH-dependent reductase (Old Yellow Enzyme family)